MLSQIPFNSTRRLSIFTIGLEVPRQNVGGLPIYFTIPLIERRDEKVHCRRGQLPNKEDLQCLLINQACMLGLEEQVYAGSAALYETKQHLHFVLVALYG